MTTKRQRIVALLLEAAKKKHSEAVPDDTVCIAPYSPSPMEMVVQVWDRLRPSVSADDVVVELGCGDARWIIHGVETCGVQAVGIEYDPNVAALAVNQVRNLGLHKRISIVVGDIIHPDFQLPPRTSIVIVYAFAETLNFNIKQLLLQCKPKTKIISVGFHMNGWTPVWSERFAGLMCYYYEL
ncbi:unnamed protein product [Aphanomyces euteiches]|nr:hypothetical protein Ae201684P_015146 [Aphanomyces euteiches]KAH9139359.1 hypothetical protein AeRB84_016382 [Aphanomyces euteiches]